MKPRIPKDIPPIVTHLVDVLGCISTPSRTVSEVRFYGTQKHLAAYCTDGHVLARLVVKADFSDFGQRSVIATVARARYDWRWTERGLIAATLGFSTEPPALVFHAISNEPSRARLDKQFDVSGDHPVIGFWGGEPMRKAFEVVESLGAAVTFRGNKEATGPLLLTQRDLAIDVRPHSFFADLDIVVMPRREP